MDMDTVKVSQTAKKKCFRMISEDRLKNIVKKSNHWEHDAGNVYIIRDDYINQFSNRHEVEIVVAKEGKEATVVTQKHMKHGKRRR